jgi:hypothetical protein
MNILEIVKRKAGSKFQLEEVVFVVAEYIKEKKGVNVDINLEKGVNRRSPLFSMMYQDQLKKLYDAFDIASDYFIKKEDDKI